MTSERANQSTPTFDDTRSVDTGEGRVFKIHHPNRSTVSDECSLLGNISHAGFIQGCEVATDGGSVLSMPFVFGGDLLNWIQTCPLDEDIVKRYYGTYVTRSCVSPCAWHLASQGHR
jgi:hypothetical protein